jgi:hypothetical protein
MSPLAEIQSRVRYAVVTGEVVDLAGLLVGGRDAEKRLAIHHRHYESSLVTALVDKFPGTAWLVGSPFITEAAKQFVRRYPPSKACVAEYGEQFPEFLSTCPDADRVAYLRSFAELEWHVAQVSLAIDHPALTLTDLSGLDPGVLTDIALRLQPGTRYLHAPWPVDDLIKIYLSDSAPEQFALRQGDVWLEVRGARGTFEMTRIDAAEFLFRQGLANGRTLGEAAERALDVDAAFDPGRALSNLLDDGLVTAVVPPAPKERG